MNPSLALAALSLGGNGAASASGNLLPPPTAPPSNVATQAFLQWYDAHSKAVNTFVNALAGRGGASGGSSTPAPSGGGMSGGGGGGGGHNANLAETFSLIQNGGSSATHSNLLASPASGGAATPLADPQPSTQPGSKVKPDSGSPPAPTAYDDTLQTNRYIARESVSSTEPSVFNAAADAGVQTNDTVGTVGDLLISGPVGGPVPPLGGSSTFATTLGGVVTLGADGSFSYTPPVGVTGLDTFFYVDTEVTQSGAFVATSGTATVQIGIEAQSPPTRGFLPGVAPAAARTDMMVDTWPKYHSTPNNWGVQTVGARDTLANVTGSLPTLGNTVEASPVLGAGPNGADTFFVQEDTGPVVAIGAASGAVLWQSSATTNATTSSLLALKPGPSGADYLVVGQSGNLLALDSSSGGVDGTFKAGESFTDSDGTFSNDTGPIKSSPTLIADPSTDTRTPAAENAIVFGTDASQGAGISQGRLYALRPDGTVAWETLLAGNIDGGPAIAPSSTMFPRGLVFVGTSENNWGGRPDGLGTLYGRFYQIDAGTGQVLADNYVMGTPNSPVYEPGLLAGTDPFGADAGVFDTTTNGSANQGKVLGLNPVIAAPPAGFESPVMTTLWAVQGGLTPTSPALSVDRTKIYFGDGAGLEAYATLTGANLWTVNMDPNGTPFTNGALVAAPAVVPLMGAGGAQTTTSEIIFGTNNQAPGLYDYVDGASGPTFLWKVNPDPNQPASFDQASPAISSTVLGPGPSFNDTVFAVAEDGSMIAVG
jgi:hypothetical protein